VVRRDRADVFETLQGQMGEGNLADVIWDRRFWDRRSGISRTRQDRRRGDRRHALPDTWETLGYVLIPLRQRTTE
jgi:hypothetical protein